MRVDGKVEGRVCTPEAKEKLSSKAAMSAKQRGPEEDVLVVVIEELRWVVAQEAGPDHARRRIAPEALGLAREDDPHVLFGWFTACDRLCIIPNLVSSRGHQPEQWDF